MERKISRVLGGIQCKAVYDTEEGKHASKKKKRWLKKVLTGDYKSIFLQDHECPQ